MGALPLQAGVVAGTARLQLLPLRLQRMPTVTATGAQLVAAAVVAATAVAVVVVATTTMAVATRRSQATGRAPRGA